MMNGVNLWIVEAILGLMAVIALVMIIIKWRNENETLNSSR
jgi:hypothetical protein